VSTPEPNNPVGKLLDLLDLKPLGQAYTSIDGVPGDEETDLGDAVHAVFVAPSQRMPHGRVFGGQVLAQSVVAAGRTVVTTSEHVRAIHSMHAYFLRPGDADHEIRFVVEALHDGRSFSTRRVLAVQYGRPILAMTASFQEPAQGMEHQDEMPRVSSPDSAPDDSAAVHDATLPGNPLREHHRPIEQRHLDGILYVEPAPEQVAHQDVWLRARGPLPDDPNIHAAVLAYASDYSLLEPILRRHGVTWADPRLRPASLDHAMWFHRPGRADEWVLYSQRSPSAQGGRGLGIGRMFSADGRLIASVAQEGMLRLKDGSARSAPEGS
jgi:acyl-CoA thioesterase-2